VSIWQAVRQELRGAWRSLHYDLNQRAGDPDQRAGDWEEDTERLAAYEAPPRRLRAIAVVGVTAVVVLGGAIGGYFAVVGGVGALMNQSTLPPDALPAVAHPSSSPSRQDDPLDPTTRMRGRLTSATPAEHHRPTPSHSPPAIRPTPTCPCGSRPAPTPSAPRPPVPTPTGIPSVTPSQSEPPSPTPSASTTNPAAAAGRPAKPGE
jgi:hypothetical protein